MSQRTAAACHPSRDRDRDRQKLLRAVREAEASHLEADGALALARAELRNYDRLHGLALEHVAKHPGTPLHKATAIVARHERAQLLAELGLPESAPQARIEAAIRKRILARVLAHFENEGNGATRA